jgi:hypothetical protein
MKDEGGRRKEEGGIRNVVVSDPPAAAFIERSTLLQEVSLAYPVNVYIPFVACQKKCSITSK